MILSILIPTIKDRHEMFTRLYNELYKQKQYMDTVHPTLGNIEILVNDGKKFLEGGLSIGKKREALVGQASGKYLCFLDDDESIAPNYLETLVRMCIKDQDICTFRAIVKMDNLWALVDMSLSTKENQQLTTEMDVLRPPWQMCPMKSVYAKMFDFNDKNAAEDFEWMEKVLSCCKSEVHTNTILFQYNHSMQHSEASKIMGWS